MLNHFQYSALIGTMLGDMFIGIEKKGFEAHGSFAHSLDQEQYCLHKSNLFKDFDGVLSYKSNKDKRTGKTYYSVFRKLNCNPLLTELQKIFYKDRIKIIPDLIYSDFNEISLAYLFMDDGCHHKNGYYISLCNFTLNDLKFFCKFLKEKFNLKCTVHRQKQIYIWKESISTFNKLVSPYIINNLKYKLHKI